MKQPKKLFFIFLILMALVFSGCQKENDVTIDSNEGSSTQTVTISDSESKTIPTDNSDSATTEPTATTEPDIESATESTEPTTESTESADTQTTTSGTEQATIAPVVENSTENGLLSDAYKQIYKSLNLDAEGQAEFVEKIEKEFSIPVISIATKDKQNIVSREKYVQCAVDVFSCDENLQLYGVSAGIKLRGNSTAFYGDAELVLENQVPYRIKFDTKTSMQGLNDGAKCKNWVLLKSNWNLIMDYTAFKMADKIIENYSSDCELVAVYVNQEFMGIYVLCEQNQVNENRVDVTEVPKDYKGTDIGYFVEIDNYAGSDPGDYYFYVSYCNATLTDIEGTSRALVGADYTIKNDIYSQTQVEFISKYINSVFYIMYEAIENENYLTFDKNYNTVKSSYTNARDTISAVADLESIVNMYILYEMVHDYDCGEGSFYMCVDFSKNSKYPKLTFICPWDFNWAYSDEPEGCYYAAAFNRMSFVNDLGDRSNPWFILLNTEQWFVDMVKSRWQELSGRELIKSVLDEINEKIDTYATDYNKKEEYAVACAKDVIKWVSRRARWLDGIWGK